MADSIQVGIFHKYDGLSEVLVETFGKCWYCFTYKMSLLRPFSTLRHWTTFDAKVTYFIHTLSS